MDAAKKRTRVSKVKSDIIKKLIDEVINDKTRPKLNFKILRKKSNIDKFLVEEVTLPTHLTIEKI